MSNLRVYYHILGTETYYQMVSSVEEAKLVIDSIAKFINMKVDEGVFPDHCSVAGLEEYDEDDNEWYVGMMKTDMILTNILKDNNKEREVLNYET